MLTVPADLGAVTPSWMTGALAGRLPGAVVGEVEVGAVEHGTNARARVRLAYTRGSGPASVFVKGPGSRGHRLALAVLGAAWTEALLAGSGAELGARRPILYAGGVDRMRLAGVVVMEDVVDAGGRPNAATTPLPVDEVASGLEELARLHATFWGRPLPASLGFLRPWRMGRLLGAVSVANLARGLRRLARWHDQVVPGARGLARQFAASAVLARSGPQTVLHGDPHPGNTYAAPGGRTGFYDWQLARTGNWSHDVGYFVVGSLDVEDRRRHERDLLSRYLDALQAAGVGAPDAATAWRRYRTTPAFGLATWVHTLGFGTFQPREVCLATIRRFAAAYEDLDTARSEVADPDRRRP